MQKNLMYREKKITHILWITALVSSILIIVYLTLSPGSVKKGINLIPFKDYAVFVRMFSAHRGMSLQKIPRWVLLNLFGNLALFIPFGFFLSGFLSQSALSRSFRIVALSGCLLSIGIELLQLFIPTRATDIDDVILNTVSTCLGFMLFFILRNLVVTCILTRRNI